MAKPGEAAAAYAAQEPFLLPPPPHCYGIPVSDYQAPHPQQPYLIVVPTRRRRSCRSALLCSSLLALLGAALLLGAAAFILWPAGPDVGLARVDLRSIRVSASRHGGVAVDVDVGVKVRVHNPNAFALRCDRLTVEVRYRGRRLGSVNVGGGLLRARAATFVEVRVRVEDMWVLEDTALLIEDMARGRIPFDAVAKVKGRLHLLGRGIPVKMYAECERGKDILRNQCGCGKPNYRQPRLLSRAAEALRIDLGEENLQRYRNLMHAWVSPSSSSVKAKAQRHIL